MTLSDKDYLDALRAKLGEELKEYQEDYSIEELTDLQEVVDAIVKAELNNLAWFDFMFFVSFCVLWLKS